MPTLELDMDLAGVSVDVSDDAKAFVAILKTLGADGEKASLSMSAKALFVKTSFEIVNKATHNAWTKEGRPVGLDITAVGRVMQANTGMTHEVARERVIAKYEATKLVAIGNIGAEAVIAFFQKNVLLGPKDAGVIVLAKDLLWVAVEIVKARRTHDPFKALAHGWKTTVSQKMCLDFAADPTYTGTGAVTPLFCWNYIDELWRTWSGQKTVKNEKNKKAMALKRARETK